MIKEKDMYAYNSENREYKYILGAMNKLVNKSITGDPI